ncbi:hypothetical protein Tco_1052168, partial [Tanacetum coccineum]
VLAVCVDCWIVEGLFLPFMDSPPLGQGSNTDEVLGRQWDRVNAVLFGMDFKLFLPDVGSACATISSEESHRVTSSSVYGFSQTNQDFAFVSNVPTRGNFQRVDRCFKIIGYPADFEKKKSRQNSKGKNVFNNNVVGSGSSSGFTDEQMATLISLIKDNKAGKNVQANMTGMDIAKIQENGQNRTNTDTGMERVHKSRKFSSKGNQKSTLGQPLVCPQNAKTFKIPK